MSGSPFRRWMTILSGQKRGPGAAATRAALWPLSMLYRLGIGVRNRRFGNPSAITQVEVPVISVGNLTTGGTGKTPMVQWICQRLRQQNRRVALLSRGYGRQEHGVNDEALELELGLPDVPHLQDPDRVQMAGIAIEELAAQILVLDDGFQHRRLARDLDLVLIDATNPFGYGYCLPRGLLREPKTELRRADAVIITRVDLVSDHELQSTHDEIARYIRPDVPIAHCVHRPCRAINSGGKSKDISELTSKPAVAVAGIGNPGAFYQSLRDQGITVLETRDYPDHYRYQRDDIDQLKAWLADIRKQYPEVHLWTTRKDLVKLGIHQLAGVPVWALEIEIQFRTGQQAIEALIDRCSERCPEDDW